MAVAEATGVNRSAPACPPPLSSTKRAAIPPRVWIIAIVLAIECLAISRFSRPWLTIHQLMAAPIVFCAALLFFARAKLQAAHLDAAPINTRFGLLHVLALALITALDLTLSHFITHHSFAAYTAKAVWYASILLLVFSLIATLFPLRRLWNALRSLGTAWIFATLTTVAAMSARTLTVWLWNAPDSRLGSALQTATFAGVKALLSLFYNNIVSIPNLAILGTARFKVQIAGTCSGIEGLALILIFTIGWLVFARRELRLKRALLLVPLALVTAWLLNLVRIAALIAIGDAGHAAIASNGFHSEAGWILFNAVALAFLLAAEHLRWLHRDTPPTQLPAQPSATLHDRNPAAPYLVPFLAVLATSLLTRAASSGFEALYPLRLAGALITLWWFRADYRRLYLQSEWSFGWPGPLAGATVFALWLPLSHLLVGSSATSTLAIQLTQLPHWQRVTWLTLRAISAIVTVPIIEELAFRGYLARRIQSADIENLPFAQLSIIAILISSVAFGALHGRMWIGGILSGIVFALVAKFRNRLGEAVAAHATANLLIAIWVLTRSDYSLW